MASSRSKTVTWCPALVSCCAAASPAGPDPTTATVNRVRVDAEHAGCLAGGGAQPPGELGEVVRRVQPVGRGRPVGPVDEVVPLGYEVAERAAVVAERDAAVHAARRLPLGPLAGERLVH